MDLTKIPAVLLDSSRKLVLEQIMTVGNEALHKAHAVARKTLDNVRYPRSSFRKDLFAKMDANKGNAIKLHGAKLSVNDVTSIQCVREIEWDVLCGYSRLIEHHANKFSRNRNGLEFSDLYQDGTIALQAAVYGYKHANRGSGTVIKFITYAHHVIYRKMVAATLKCTPLSPSSDKARKLLRGFKCAKKDLNGPATFDEVVMQMGLSQDQIGSLQAMLRKVVSASMVTNTEESKSDYSVLSVESQNEVPEKLDEIQKQAIFNAGLNAWEQTVLKAFLAAAPGEHGWKTEVASKTINPVTGKKYSRMAPLLAMRRIKEKIINAYTELKEAA